MEGPGPQEPSARPYARSPFNIVDVAHPKESIASLPKRKFKLSQVLPLPLNPRQQHTLRLSPLSLVALPTSKFSVARSRSILNSLSSIADVAYHGMQ
jgi:hypothetical protein